MKKTPAQYAKSVIAVIGLAVTVASALGLAQEHWVSIVIAILTALGVYTVPNKSQVPDLGSPGIRVPPDRR
jgi:uncharacterized membrane protein